LHCCCTFLQVLMMLLDVQLAAVTSRPLGSHTAHMMWQDTVGSPQLSAMPGVPVTLQQVRLLCCSAVSWLASRLPRFARQ
jgi:hypothetical protein